MNKFKTLKDHVYDYILGKILEGELMPNERINETDISETLSISRTPVREALIQLSSEGMLDNLPRKGFVLKGTTKKEASDLYEVIGVLDATSAKFSYKKLDEKDYTNMDYHIRSMYYAIGNSDYEMYLEHQELFHNVYLEKCDNEVLYDTITRLKKRFFTRGYTKTSEEQDATYLTQINEEHEYMLKLFKEKKIEELMKYISDVHWTAAQAHNELFRGNKK